MSVPAGRGSVSDGDLHRHGNRYGSRGCAILVACSIVVVLASCTLASAGIRSGAVAPIATNRHFGPVQLVAFVLCTSPWPADPCTTGRRSYEVWLLVDWKRLGLGNPKSYPLMIMPLQE
jgi:hypothetical protein